MAISRSFVAAIVALGCFVHSQVAAQELSDLRSEVRTPSPTNNDRSDQKPDRNDYDEDPFEDDAYEEGWDSLLLLVGAGLTIPWWGPHVAMNDSFSTPGYFAHYPYQYDVGYMLIDPVEAFGLPGPAEPYAWAARTRAEVGTDFSGIDWIGGRVAIDTKSRFGVESDFRYVLEEFTRSNSDSIWLGDANVLLRFAQCEWMQFHTGIGANFLSDTDESDFGFNFTYRVDAQPVRPLLLSAELDLGWLGHASVVHVRTTAGVAWGVSEAYVGYDLYDIGSAEIGGLVAGVQLWY